MQLMKHLQIPLSDAEEAVHSLMLENIRLKSEIEILVNEMNVLKQELNEQKYIMKEYDR